MRPLSFLFLLLSLALAGCTSPGDDEEKIPANTVLAKGGGDNNVFDPKELTVSIGTTVTWRGHSGDHTVTFKAPVNEHEDAPDSGNLAVDQEFEVEFREAGTYGYRCIYHSFGFGENEGMTGTVTVT